MSTPPVIQKMLDWQKANAGRVPYSESASTRLLADDAHMLSATDCSGMFHRMLVHYAGVDPGTYTGNQCQSGTLVTTSKTDARAGRGLLPGDGILFRWENRTLGSDPWDHIAMYAGAGRIWNHGGPGYGPLDWSLQNNVDNAVAVMVRRYVTSSTTTPDSSGTQEENMDLTADNLTKIAEAVYVRLRPLFVVDENNDGKPDVTGTVQGAVKYALMQSTDVKKIEAAIAAQAVAGVDPAALAKAIVDHLAIESK